MTTKHKKVATEPEVREGRTVDVPAMSRQQAEAQAAKRVVGRPPSPEVEFKGEKIGPREGDPVAHVIHMLDTLGTRSQDFLSVQLGHLEHSGRQRGQTERSAVATNSALAIVAAVQPENEIEAALAVQMAGTHALAMELLGRARHTDRTDHIQLYGGLAVKLQRTFVAQVEALAKLRSGGKQQVEVRHVYINGNAVIGDVHATGGGASAAFSDQPHTQGLPHLPGAPCPPMRGQDPEGVALSVAGGGGEAPVSDARRRRGGRCAAGEG